jgi:hypothetical protein
MTSTWPRSGKPVTDLPLITGGSAVAMGLPAKTTGLPDG